MKKVTFEHEEGDVLHVVASEVADELDRAQKDQDRLLECSCEDLATASNEFSNCFATHEAASVKLSSAFREATVERPTRRPVPRYGGRATRPLNSNAKPQRSPTEKEPGALPMCTPGRKHWSTTGWEHWGIASEVRPRPHTL